MKSYSKFLLLIAITLILAACGGTETSTGEVANNVIDDGTQPVVVVNNPPEISGTPLTTASVGMLYSFTPSSSDPDGDSLSFSSSTLPAWASLDTVSGTISGTPSSSDVGLTGDIVLSVSDGKVQSSLSPFSITVVDGSIQQVVSARISSGMDDVEEEADSSMYLDSSDLELINDGADQLVGLRFIVSIPQNALVTQANLRFTTDEVSTTETDLVIWAQASDDAEAFSDAAGNLSGRSSTVSTVTWKPLAWNSVGESGAAQTTSDLSAVIQEIVARPGWHSGNHLVLVFSGRGVRTAESYEGGPNNAPVLTVSYTTGTVDPIEDNQAPIITGVPNSGATEGYAYSFTPSASDPDGDNLTFSVTNMPAWATFNSQSGTLSGTPTEGDAGSYESITITVSDGELSSTLNPFTILVSASNRAPTISGVPVTTVVELGNYSFIPSASDPDGDTISFSITNKPSWAVFDTTTGSITGTPGYDDAGSYGNIVISVTDGSFNASLPPFAITVADLNRLPVISGTPGTSVSEGSSYSFTPIASDLDGDNLTYSIANRPVWASFNTRTGTLSGTPGSDAAGSYGNITISVSDGVASASLPSFGIEVTNVNQTPSISGSPVLSVSAGNSYSFTPNANDDDGDNLTFSVNNLPSWANFDSTTGTLAGMPDSGDVGTFTNITISVTDGTEQVSLTAFSITVNAVDVSTGSMSLRWSAPTTRADGSALSLSEIGGYCIYVGTSSDTLEMLVDVNDGATTNYTIDDLAVGTYFVAVTTYDVDGVASSYSNIIEKSVTN